MLLDVRGRLDGKTVLVTGASRGIGKEIALLFARAGGRVVCSARTLREGDHQLEGSLESTVAEIRAAGGEATAVAADISDLDQCEQLAREAERTYGPVNVLVNNAAMNAFLEARETAPRRWVRTFAVNVHAPFALVHAVLPSMLERRAGAIVNISSGSAIGPGRGPYADAEPNRAVLYGATKAALERFTQGLAQEVYGFSVAVSAVAPSQLVMTPGARFHAEEGGYANVESEPPEYMATAALLLTTEPLDNVTGRVTYSQQLLQEYGLIASGRGAGIDRPGSGYAQG